jgi:hypothetical protein
MSKIPEKCSFCEHRYVRDPMSSLTISICNHPSNAKSQPDVDPESEPPLACPLRQEQP